MERVQYTEDNKPITIGMRLFWRHPLDPKSATEGREVTGYCDLPYYMDDDGEESWVPVHGVYSTREALEYYEQQSSST